MDISSMLEVQVKEMKAEVDVKENVTPRDQMSSIAVMEPIPVSQDEKNFYQLMFGNDIASVRFRRLHCTACDVHIGSAPSQAYNMLEHPVLRTLLCVKCRDFYGDGTFEQGDDATDMFCRWCANGGNLYCCSYCSNTFCYKCIRRNFTVLVRKKIEADEKWKCFVCNPSDLFSARAVCKALIQHVQTVTRILKNEKKMSPEEIEEKMNLDESQCCPRRNKRRCNKRKIESNSEEEDETYIPKANGLPVHVKRKLRKVKPNGTVTRQLPRYSIAPIPIRPRPTVITDGHSLTQVDSQSLYPQESVMIECEQPISSCPFESIVMPPSSTVNPDDVSLSSNYDTNIFPTHLYHTTIMNHAAASSTYIRSPTVNPATHKIFLPPQPQQSSSQTQNSYHPPFHSSSNAMVSIPNPASSRKSRLFVHNNTRKSDVTLTPNVIELDSDSDDELRILEQHTNPITGNSNDVDVVNVSSQKVVPVALVSTENGDDNVREEQSLRLMRATLEKPPASFHEIMLPYSLELDKLLDSAKEKAYKFFTPPNNDAVKDIASAAHQKIKQFHQAVRKLVFHLAHINDRAVREYNKWERSRKLETVPSFVRQNTSISQASVKIPLDMICINDSEIESDCEKSEYQIEPSELVKNSSIIKDLFFPNKDVVHRSIGGSATLYENKEVQVYDVVLRDYEKCIPHSVLMKANYESETDDSVLKFKTIPDENFGKYEEQFINYLQYIEDHGIETEDMRGLVDSTEIFPEKSMDVNSSHILKSPQNSELREASIDQLEIYDQEESLMSYVNSEINNDTDASISAIDKSNRTIAIINDSNADSGIKDADVQSNDKIQETESQKIYNRTNNEEIISIDLLNDMILSKNADVADIETAATGSEEDCTIIDD